MPRRSLGEGGCLPLDLALAISTAHPTRQGAKLQPVKRALLAVALLAAPVTSAREVTFERALAEFFVATEVSDREKAARRLLKTEPGFSVILARLRTGRVYLTKCRCSWGSTRPTEASPHRVVAGE